MPTRRPSSCSRRCYPAPLDAWYEVRVSPDGEGLALCFLDITARRRDEEAHDLAARRLSGVAEDALGLAEADGLTERPRGGGGRHGGPRDRHKGERRRAPHPALVERRDEHLGDGLARLRRNAAALGGQPLEELCSTLLARQSHGHEDHVALIALRARD
ncbi:hypothetical protein [Cellulomonas sp. NS3]|uniref:hypothetical protein n=1 Tax=Cellulomonas sp. NS3 TaxID=2973977 RepID=UPI0021623706|nr:hypothetical protein [Cellulomonas sp. NS3]